MVHPTANREVPGPIPGRGTPVQIIGGEAGWVRSYGERGETGRHAGLVNRWGPLAKEHPVRVQVPPLTPNPTRLPLFSNSELLIESPKPGSFSCPAGFSSVHEFHSLPEP